MTGTPSTGDVATEHIGGLSRLKSYYAGDTQITDRSLEILGRMTSLEKLEFWACAGVTNAGVAHLAGLPRLREISLDGLGGVTREAAGLFPAHVRVNYSGSQMDWTWCAFRSTAAHPRSCPLWQATRQWRSRLWRLRRRTSKKAHCELWWLPAISGRLVFPTCRRWPKADFRINRPPSCRL